MGFLIFAFAQPFIISGAEKDGANPSDIVLLIDNSLSMNRYEGSNNLLDISKELSVNIINEKSGGNRYYLLTNDFEHSNFTSLDGNEIADEIKKLGISNNIGSFKEFKERIAEIKHQNNLTEVDVYAFSDFQESQYPIKEMSNINEDKYNFIKIQTEEFENVSVDSAWMTNPVPTINASDSLFILIFD